MPTIAERLAAARDSILGAARRAGRDPANVELLAVSKTHPPEALREAIEAGQVLFGESRVQEARVKIPLLPARTRWHFIGHLQSNKIRHALSSEFELLHSIDSLQLAHELNRIAQESGRHPRILLEVNVAGEATKFGFSPAALRAVMPQLLGFERLQVEGLMTIAPLGREAEDSRPYFNLLREFRDKLETEFGVRLSQLSMGMSGDFAVAVEEGATIVRVGSAIFGRRAGKSWRPAVDRSTIDD